MFLKVSPMLSFAIFLCYLAVVLQAKAETEESLNMREILDTIDRTSIVTYKKKDISEDKIQSFFNQLQENDPSLKVEHLTHVGAFIITFDNRDNNRMAAGRKMSLQKMLTNS